MKKIETLHNEFIEQLKTLLLTSYPKAFGFDIKYFIGEDEGVKGLYVSIESKIFGIVYRKRMDMKSHELIMDVEEPFINDIINDLVLSGVMFLNGEALRSREEEKMSNAIVATEFKHVRPILPIYVN